MSSSPPASSQQKHEMTVSEDGWRPDPNPGYASKPKPRASKSSQLQKPQASRPAITAQSSQLPPGLEKLKPREVEEDEDLRSDEEEGPVKTVQSDKPLTKPKPFKQVMTIGTYVSAPQEHLLLLKDPSSARAADVDRIYRSLGGVLSLGPNGEAPGFEQHLDRCFVGPEARAVLMARLDAAFAAAGSVGADTKLSLDLGELETLVGAASLAAMRESFAAPIDKVKMRRVCVPAGAEHRSNELIDFHFDSFSKTMGIALNDASEYSGSRLTFALPGTGELVQPERRAGTATIHTNRVAHGVTPLIDGVRYGLFLLSR